MLIIFGFRTRPSKVSEGQFFCPRDGGNRPYVHSRYRRWFTLFFIPIFPTGKYTGEFVKCQACGTVYRPDVLGGARSATTAASYPAPVQQPQYAAPDPAQPQPQWQYPASPGPDPAQPQPQPQWQYPGSPALAGSEQQWQYPGSPAVAPSQQQWPAASQPATPPSTFADPGQGDNTHLA